MPRAGSNQPEKGFDSNPPSPTLESSSPGRGRSRRFQSTRSNDKPGTVRGPVLLCGVCQLIFKMPDQLHQHRRCCHFECKNCSFNDGIPRSSYYKSIKALHKHIRNAHPLRWCDLCRAPFADASQLLHMSRDHPHCCLLCHQHLDDLVAHFRANHSFLIQPTVPPERPPPPPAVGKYYSLLDVSPTASAAEIVKAARTARVHAHPDRHLCGGATAARTRMVNERAMEVGRAADVLCDERARRKYDLDVKQGRRG